MHCEVWGILHLHISVHVCSGVSPTCQNGMFQCLYVAILSDYCVEETRCRSPISKCSTVLICENGSQPSVPSARYVLDCVRVGDVHLLSVTVQSDHKPLESISKKPLFSAPIACFPVY